MVDAGMMARRIGAYDVVEPLYSWLQQRRWHAAGEPIPAPSAVKRSILREYGRRYALRTLVETGTYKADTVRALRSDFESIHSIEISDHFYGAAAKRSRRQKNATIHHGDSGVLLEPIVAEFRAPALFWLDAHFSGGATGGAGEQPVVAEVTTLMEQALPHVILIDDVREFGTDPDYPTLQAIQGLATTHGYAFEVALDIARLVPNQSVPT